MRSQSISKCRRGAEESRLDTSVYVIPFFSFIDFFGGRPSHTMDYMLCAQLGWRWFHIGGNVGRAFRCEIFMKSSDESTAIRWDGNHPQSFPFHHSQLKKHIKCVEFDSFCVFGSLTRSPFRSSLRRRVFTPNPTQSSFPHFAPQFPFMCSMYVADVLPSSTLIPISVSAKQKKGAKYGERSGKKGRPLLLARSKRVQGRTFEAMSAACVASLNNAFIVAAERLWENYSHTMECLLLHQNKKRTFRRIKLSRTENYSNPIIKLPSSLFQRYSVN